jgi:hypothetical protein
MIAIALRIAFWSHPQADAAAFHGAALTDGKRVQRCVT